VTEVEGFVSMRKLVAKMPVTYIETHTVNIWRDRYRSM